MFSSKTAAFAFCLHWQCAQLIDKALRALFGKFGAVVLCCFLSLNALGQSSKIIGGGVSNPPAAGGSIAFVQAASCNVTSTATSITVGASCVGTAQNFGSNVGSGHLLFVDFVSFNPSTLSATDSLSTSFTCTISPTENSFYQGVCYGKTTSGGADTITLTAGLTITPTVVVIEVSGLTSYVPDGTIGSSNFNAPASSTSWTGPGITTSNANDIVFGCFGNNGTNNVYTAGSGFTIPANAKPSGGNQSSACEYQIVSSTGTYTPTMTGTGTMTTIGGTIAFK